MSCLLTYIPSISGDCSNSGSGAFSIDITGSAPDYTIQWVSPASGTTALGAGVTAYTVNSLTAGTYSFNIIDSCSPVNTVLPVNIFISSGTSMSISGIENTLCGDDNGSITATTQNVYGVAEFYLYDNTGGYVTSGSSFGNDFEFNNLSASTYYVVGDDGGGCTGKSETVIVQSSTTIDYGFYTVADAGCSVNSGKIFITGLTGNPPYTYLWSNGGTTDSISGLTAGTYSVSVTDDTGCSVSKGTSVIEVLPVGFGSFTSVNPSCEGNDGEITITVTGGTEPFYYSGSNGNTNITFDRSYTFTNLTSGIFNVQVTDAGLCSFTNSTTLSPTGGLSVLSVSKTNSFCDNNGGTITINLFGGSPPYTYTLDNPDGSSVNYTVNNSSYVFNNLSGGTYQVTISDLGPCEHIEEVTISDESVFEIETLTTGTTCNGSDGSVTIEVSSGATSPFLYQINGQSITTGLTSHTFNNLTSGGYTATVTDNTGCAQTELFSIDFSSTVDFVLTSTNANTGSDGSVTAFITSGEPPFTYDWVSNNVGGQTGDTVTNLSAGTYTLKITDDNSCVKQRSVTLTGFNSISSRQTYNVCNDDFENEGTVIIKGPREMLNEGFYDLTLNDIDCILNSAVFETSVSLGESSVSEQFYTGYTLNDFPGDNIWLDSIERLTESFSAITDLTYIIEDDYIKITTECNYDGPKNYKVNLTIHYDIECVSCGVNPTPTPTTTTTPTPTPTKTPQPTPTSTPGTTPTPTPTPTPTVTNTQTPTPTTTSTPTPTPTCVCLVYEVWATGSTSGSIGYYNCKGLRSNATVAVNQPITICATEIITSFGLDYSSFGCCGEDIPIPSQTPTPTVTPTNTQTPTPTLPNSQFLIGSRSSLSDSSDACPFTLDTDCWIRTYGPGIVPQSGDIVYNDFGGTTTFNGGNLYYKIEISLGGVPVSVRINSFGVVGGVSSIC